MAASSVAIQNNVVTEVHTLAFDSNAGKVDGTIQQILSLTDCDSAFLVGELKKFGIESSELTAGRYTQALWKS